MEMVMKMRRRKLLPSFVFIFIRLSLRSLSLLFSLILLFVHVMQNSFGEIANAGQLELKASDTCVNRHTCLPLSFSLGDVLPEQREWREGRQVSWGTAWKQDNQSCSLAPDSNLNATFDKSTYDACREYSE